MEEIISIKHFWDAVSSISFIMLTIFLARIARKQNIIQENALKLEMYDKYYQIINALEADIEYYNSLKSAIVLSLKGNPNVAKMYFKFNREIDKILPLAKQLLTKEEYADICKVRDDISCITSTLNDMCIDLVLINEDEKHTLLSHLKYTDNNLYNFFNACKNDITSRELSGYHESIIYNANSINRIINDDKLLEILSAYCDLSGFINKNRKKHYYICTLFTRSTKK